jgi:hypothetical protein
MFDNVITFLLALDCHFDQGVRLSHVDTEGREVERSGFEFRQSLDHALNDVALAVVAPSEPPGPRPHEPGARSRPCRQAT